MPNIIVSAIVAWGLCLGLLGPANASQQFPVNTFTTLNQWLPSIAVLPDESFVVVWQSDVQHPRPRDHVGDIYGQHFAKDGSKIGGEFQINDTSTKSQTLPVVTVLNDGSLVAVWVSDHDNALGNIYGQRFAAFGTRIGPQFQVRPSSGAQNTPAIAALPDGGFVVVWAGSPDGSSDDTYDIFGQRFAPNGARAGGQFRVNGQTAGAQLRASVVARPFGGFVVAWDSAEGSSFLIRGQRYDANGARDGRAFTVVKHGSDTRRPRLAKLERGGFVVVWEWLNKQLVYNAYAQRYSDAGDKVGDTIQASPKHHNQFNPNVVGLENGSFVVAWADEFAEIMAQRFTPNGAASGETFRINDNSDQIRDWPVMVPSGHRGFLVVWDGQDGSGLGVFGRRFAQ